MSILSLPRRRQRGETGHPYPEMPDAGLSVTEAIAALPAELADDDGATPAAPSFTPAQDAIRRTRPMAALAEAQSALAAPAAFTKDPDVLRRAVTALRGKDIGAHPFSGPAHAKSSPLADARKATLTPLPPQAPGTAVMTAGHSAEWLAAAGYPAPDVTSATTAADYASLMARISLVTGTTGLDDAAAWGGSPEVTRGPGAGFWTRRRPAWMPAAWLDAYAEIADWHRFARAEITTDADRFAVMERHRAEAADIAHLLPGDGGAA